MVCFVVPAAAAVLAFAGRKLLGRKDEESKWLTLMLGGGAIFGVVDHWWNGELFLVGSNIASDLALGLTITLSVVAAWAVVVFASRAGQPNKSRVEG